MLKFKLGCYSGLSALVAACSLEHWPVSQYESLVMDYLCQVREGWWWWWQLCIIIFSSALAHFLFFLRMVLPVRTYSCISGCRVPDAGGPRNASGNHL